MRPSAFLGLVLALACSDSTGPGPGSSLHNRIVFESSRLGGEDLFVVNPDGTGVQSLPNEAGIAQRYPAISPDGRQVAFSDQLGRIWIQDHPDGTLWQVGEDYFGSFYAPRWSPDGERLVFTGPDASLFLGDVASGVVTPLLNDEFANFRPEWVLGGASIVFQSDRSGDYDLYLIDADGQNLRQLTSRPGPEEYPRASPDGMRISYGWTESLFPGDFRPGVIVLDLQTLADSVIAESVACPCSWSPDGRSMVMKDWRSGVDLLTTIDVVTGATDTVVNPPEGATESMPDWGR